MSKPPRLDELPDNVWGLMFSVWKLHGSKWLLASIIVPLYLLLYFAINTNLTVSALNKLPKLIEWQEQANERLKRIEEILKEKGFMIILPEKETVIVQYEAE